MRNKLVVVHQDKRSSFETASFFTALNRGSRTESGYYLRKCFCGYALLYAQIITRADRKRHSAAFSAMTEGYFAISTKPISYYGEIFEKEKVPRLGTFLAAARSMAKA